MTALRNWLTCLVKGHRYDITEIALLRLTFCDCCGRELFKRTSQFSPLFAHKTSLRASTLGPASFAGGEGQAEEGREDGDNEQARVAAAALAQESETNIIEAINRGRLAATTSHAIARPRNSLDARPQYIFATGYRDFLKKDMADRRFYPVNLDGVQS